MLTKPITEPTFRTSNRHIEYLEFRRSLRGFRLGHAACQLFKHVVQGDTQTANVGFTATLARFDGDDVLVIHNRSSD